MGRNPELQNSKSKGKAFILSCISYKGGVGKTTLAQNIAVAFAHSGRKVCIVDCDDSLNSQDWSKNRGEKSSDLPKIAVIGEKDEDQFPHTIEALSQEYEILIIDSPPSQSSISRMVILMSTMIVVPLLAKGSQETNTISQFVHKIKGLELTQKRNIPIYFFLNSFNPRIVHMQSFRDKMAEAFPQHVLQSFFSERKAFYRASYFGMGVTEYVQKDGNARKAAREVMALVNELAAIIGEMGKT